MTLCVNHRWKKTRVECPIVASDSPQHVICPVDAICQDFLVQSSFPSNIVQVCLPDELGGNSESNTYLWKGNVLSTPHVLHEVIHSDGVHHEVLIPDTWITGTIPRTPAALTNGDVSTTSQVLKIIDGFGSWTCCIDFVATQDVRCVLQQVVPHLRPNLIFQIQMNNKVCHWNSLVTCGELVVIPFKLKRVFRCP